MNKNQLPIFNWQARVMGEGYRCFAAFKFEEAKQHFRQVLHSRPEYEEEMRKALKACEYWQPLAPPGKKEPRTCSIDELYNHFRRYDFTNIPGLQQFKTALLEYIAGQMVAADHFYINENETVFDLLLELHHYKKAERIVLQKMKKHPDDHRLRYCLAQIQWLNNLNGEAKKNYTLALLYDPCHIPFNRILFEDLKTLINTTGPEMAPSYGWVRGILPLVPLQDEINGCSKTHLQAIDCYRLLRSADKALKKNDMDACIKHRKKLKEQAPDLYDEYYELLSNRN